MQISDLNFLKLPNGNLPAVICEIPSPGFIEHIRDKWNFDGVWVSSLTQSFQAHQADNMSLGWENYVETVARIRTVDDQLKIVVDVDALAGDPAVAAMIAKRYAQVGADALVMEDKNASAKTNSLFATGNKKIPLVTPEEMCKKLRAVRHAVEGTRTHIVARTEYLPRNMDTPDVVIDIATRYYEAGAHCIMVHNGKESENLEPLKYVLRELRDRGIPTMIVPQGFTPRSVNGEFNDLTGTIILGNVVTSKILELLEGVTREELLVKPKFGGLLQKSEEVTPKSRSMVVLGAKARPDGQYLLSSHKVRAKFIEQATKNNCSKVVFVSGEEVSDLDLATTSKVAVSMVVVKDSLGEVHSLQSGIDHVKFDDEVLICYADESVPEFDSVGQSTWYGDRFRGAMLLSAEALGQGLQQVSPQDFMVDLLSLIPTTRVETN